MPPDFLIKQVQTLFEPIALVLKLVNTLWGIGAATLVPALVFWLGGGARGFRAAWITALSGCIGTLLKWGLAMPRPFYVTDSFTPLKLTGGYGMPSGNSQGPASLLAALGRGGSSRWLWIVGVPLVLLAGIARVYYGVHSVNQVVVGWGLGVGIAALALAAERPLITLARRLHLWQQIAAILTLTGIAFGLWHGVAMYSIHQLPPPPEWASRFAALQVELDEMDERYSLVVPAEAGEVAGLLLGYGVVALVFLARGMPVVTDRRERVIAVCIGLPAFFLWSRAVGPVIRWFAAISDGVVFSLLLIPLLATLPLTLYLLVPRVALRLGRRTVH